MSAPWLEAEGTAGALLVASVLGVAFGVALEQAGLGSARKLTGQFRLTDLAVFKVMFTAIVVALLGLFWLGRLGVLEVGRVFVPPTFLVPQLVGGLLFGVGMAASGLCPGTSCVAAATLRGDGLATLGGLFTGVLLAGLCFPALEPLVTATARGPLRLPQLLGVSEGTVVLAVVLLALGGFGAAEAVERRR